MEETRLSEAREIRRLFDGERLRVARELRGLTQKAVAEAAGITSTAVGQFEKGTTTPNARTLVNLADALRVPLPFFRDDVADSDMETPAFFRSLRSTSARDQRQARAFVELVRQFTLALETRIELPRHDIPRHPIAPNRDDRRAVAAVASLVREEFSLRDDHPVDNVVRLMERHGAIITRTQFEALKIDAFSVAYEDRPVVVLCSDKGLYDRSRFDAAHELGHLVMHAPDDCGQKTTEDQANQFAAEFLMPESGIAGRLPKKANWPELVALKRKWGVSIAALLFRSKTLGVMSESAYLTAVKTMSARGWRKKEPEDLGFPESPQLLHKAVAMLNDRGTTTEDLAALAALPLDEVNRILAATSPTKPRVTL